jgi:hypothetical protein
MPHIPSLMDPFLYVIGEEEKEPVRRNQATSLVLGRVD